MLNYNDKYGEYIFETENFIFCWDKQPEGNYKEIAARIGNAYSKNIQNIAECIFVEVKDFFNVTDITDMISKLGRPTIYQNNCQVVYCEHTLDDYHIISFEYADESFNLIENVCVDG